MPTSIRSSNHIYLFKALRLCVCARTPPGRWLLKASGSAKGRITSRLSATNHFPSAQPPCLSACRSVCLFSPPPQAAVCLHHSNVLCLTTRLETFRWSSSRQRAPILQFCSEVWSINVVVSIDLFWQAVSESQFHSYLATWQIYTPFPSARPLSMFIATFSFDIMLSLNAKYNLR